MRITPNRVFVKGRILSPNARKIDLLDIVLDNLSGSTKVTGSWESSNSITGHYGPNYIYTQTNASGGMSIRWTPNIITPGTYSVFTMLPDGTVSHDSFARYDIHHKDGLSSIGVDQRIRGGKWAYLGTYQFDQGKSHYVELSNLKSSVVTLAADAMRFVYAQSKYHSGNDITLTAQVISDNTVKLNIQDNIPNDGVPYWITRKRPSSQNVTAFTIPSGTKEFLDSFNLLTTADTYEYQIRKVGYGNNASSTSVSTPAVVAKSANILVSAAGYKTESHKKVLIKASTGATSFSVINTVTGTTVLENQALSAFSDPISGDLLVGDFSSIMTEGYYKVQTNNGLRSTFFRIGEDIYDEVSGITMRNLKLNRWSFDSKIVDREDGETMDIGGGWEDAWDYKHWSSYTDTIQPFALLEMLLSGLDVPGVEEELRWGLTYLLKIQERTPGGSGVMKFGQIIAAYSEDDSIDSDPYIVRVENVDAADLGGYNKRCEHVLAHYLYVLVLAKAARYFNSDTNYSQQLRTQAIDAYNYITQYDEVSQVKYAEHFTTKDYFRAYPVLNYSYKVLASEELYQLTGNTPYRAIAKQYLNKIVQCQKKDHKWNSRRITGYFLKDELDTTPLRNRIHAGIPLYTLAVMSRQIEDSTDSEWFKWYSTMQIFIESFVKRFSSISAYEIIPYGFGVGPRKMDETDTISFRYFQGSETQADGYSDGNTKMLALYAAALYQSAITNGDKETEELAHKQLEWIFGKNHFGTPGINGFGEVKIDSGKFYSHGYPHSSFEAIGAIVNGIDGNASTDAPYWTTTWQTGETWGVNRAWIQFAIAALKKLDVAKQIAPASVEVVSITYSTESVMAGAAFTISVTIKNNGESSVTIPIKVFTDNATNNTATNSLTLDAGASQNITFNMTAGIADRLYVVAVSINGDRSTTKSVIGYVD